MPTYRIRVQEQVAGTDSWFTVHWSEHIDAASDEEAVARFIYGWYSKPASTESFDKINARLLEQAGNTASGLDFSEIGEDGHGVANLLWKLANFLRKRNL